MSAMSSLPLSAVMPQVLALLKTKQTRKMLADKINKSVDIPMIGEATELKIIKKLIKIFIQTLEEITEPDSDTD